MVSPNQMLKGGSYTAVVLRFKLTRTAAVLSRWGLPAPMSWGTQLLGLVLLKDQIKLNCLFLTKAKQSKRTLLELIFSQV